MYYMEVTQSGLHFLCVCVVQPIKDRSWIQPTKARSIMDPASKSNDPTKSRVGF